MIEETLIHALRTVCTRVHATVAPVATQRPYITWQQYGGEGLDYLDNEQPSARNAFVQINVWCETPREAATLIQDVERALRAITSPLVLIDPVSGESYAGTITVKPLGAHRGDYDPDMEVFGASQDFSVWGPI